MNRSLAYYVLRFALSVIGVTAMIWGVSVLLAQFAPEIAQMVFGGPAAIGIGVAIMIFPPLQLARVFYANEERRMGRGEGWSLAFICATLFTLVLTGLTFAALSQRAGALAEMQQVIGSDLAIAMLPLAILAVILTLIYRLFFWATIRGEVRRAERRAANG
ncbi:ABZJ_00895 family protein [Gymnodinialimonas sp. 2305UL16-5]|uniref:ABZJ_00895 family protein n=1 Tax=Gymnodinialimonas mytili TaxID=3126503 RepID=UPI0030ADEEE0